MTQQNFAARADTAAEPQLDPWRFRQTASAPQRRRHDETLFALANGSLGVRAGFEEARGGSDGTFLAGVYERHPIHYHERFPGFARTTDTRLPVADAQRIGVWLGDDRVDPDQGLWLAFERVLDLREGRLERRLRLRTPQGATIEIHAERVVPFSSKTDQGADLLAIRYRVTSIDYSGPVTLASAIDSGQHAAAQGDDPRIGTGVGQGLRVEATQANETFARMVQSARHHDLQLVATQAHRLTDPRLAFIDAEAHDDRSSQRYGAQLQPGESVVIEKFVAYTHGLPTQALAAAGEAALDYATTLGFDGLAVRQAQAMSAFWKDAELSIEGDVSAELALRFNLFHLMQSAGRDGLSGTAAKGLTGEGYEGHYFWDTEAFMLPVMAFTAPEVARAMLMARFHALEAARDHAREMNHPHGALYPWRTIAGGECSAHYPSGSAAYHINAAVAYAIGLYLDATGDVDFLAEAGMEMLLETARIWTQIGHFNPRRGGAFCIHEVTGPDEYTALADNNFYTNRMAQQHLRRAVQAWRQLQTAHPERAEALAQGLDLRAEELDTWQRAADAMFLNYNEFLGIYAQDDGFLDKPRWPFAQGHDGHRPLLLDYHPVSLYRHQVCKQADVVMALVLAGADIDVGRKRRSFDYYEAITTHDSTLSASIFGILANEVGLADKAIDYFHTNLRVDIENLHGNTDHGVHMAALAGTWLGLVQGFGGLRPVGGELRFAPTRPASWQGYGFALRWQGRRLRVRVSGQRVEYTLLEGEPLWVDHAGQRIRLSTEQPRSAPLADAAATFPRPCRALIFDLDGVLTDTARTHYNAWKRIADENGLAFDETVNERLKGVDRETSLEIILRHSGRILDAEHKRALTERKNAYYREAIASLGPQDLFPGVVRLLDQARARGLKLAVASASRNASFLLERLGIADRFDAVADAATIQHAKPDPEIFLRVADVLGVPPSECIGIEDSAAGIAAIKSAGMAAIGIGDPSALHQADTCLPVTAALRLDDFVSF